MGSTFNPQILIEKLSKLNSSQQSIETLSHWCIFHMNKAKQVVETWDRQFHCSPSEQRLAFLYLANDILQNSRRKGSEFVGEFWKVLPDALRDVMDNGDEFGRNAVRRLIGIWEERKVFGSRGQILKEEFGGRQLENSSRNGKHSGFKLKQSAGNTLEKIVSSYQLIYGGQLDEDAILRKCTNAISYIEKVDKEIGGDISSAQQNGSAFVEELQGQHTVLRDTIEQLTSVESSRASLVSYLREALQEQEFKLDQVRSQLQAAQFRAEQAGNMCQQLLTCSNNNTQLLADQSLKDAHTTEALQTFVPGTGEQSAPVMFTRQVSFPEKPGHIEEDPRKSAAAAVAAKLTASTSSAQMLTFVLSSLASEGVIGNPTKEQSGDCPAEKRPRIDNEPPSPYIPPQNPQPSVSVFPNLEQLQHSVSTTTTAQQPTQSEQSSSHPSSPPPPLPPMPPMPHYQVPQYMPSAGPVANIPYTYGMAQQQAPTSTMSFPVVGPPVSSISSFTSPPSNSYQSFQASEGGFYSQPSSLPPMAPISRR